MDNARMIIWIAAAACAAGAWWIWDRFRAKDFSREKVYSINRPFPLSGIPDLVRQQDGGELAIHDLKTRARAVWFESDKIQLSLYKLLVERATGRQVSSTGYIRARLPGRQDKLLPVPLYDEKALVALYDRYIDLLEGRRLPSHAKSKALCELCGFHQKMCFPPQLKEPAGAGSKRGGWPIKADRANRS